MSESARIHDFRALSDAKAALIKFVDEATAALASMDADVQRMSQWLSSDRPSHWKAEIRRREDAVNAAKAEIAKKQLSRAPEPASVVQERKALERAKLRLEDAQRRAENVRKWAPRWEREAMMYKGACQALSEALHRDIPLACARLDAMRNTLEVYARMAPPSESGGGVGTAPTALESAPPGPINQREMP